MPPRETAFSFVARALKLEMSECLLVDDTPLNVDRAGAAGRRDLLFTDAARLQNDLVKSALGLNGAEA